MILLILEDYFKICQATMQIMKAWCLNHKLILFMKTA